MSIKAKVILPDENKTEIIVKMKVFGPDLYIINGEVKKINKKNVVEMNVKGYKVTFKYYFSQKKDHCNVYLDDELYATDIFGLNEIICEAHSRGGNYLNWVTTAIIFVMIFYMFSLEYYWVGIILIFTHIMRVIFWTKW